MLPTPNVRSLLFRTSPDFQNGYSFEGFIAQMEHPLMISAGLSAGPCMVLRARCIVDPVLKQADFTWARASMLWSPFFPLLITGKESDARNA